MDEVTPPPDPEVERLAALPAPTAAKEKCDLEHVVRDRLERGASAADLYERRGIL